MKNETENNHLEDDADRKGLQGLLGFAQGVLTARAKVQMTMGAGLGVFHENDIVGLPGVQVDCDDGAWIRIARQRETRPPEPAEHVATFLVTSPTDPSKAPQLKDAVSVEVTIEEASDLVEGELVQPDNVHAIVEKGVTVDNRVRAIILAKDCPEMRRDFEQYLSGPWAEWAKAEEPVRKSISLYNDLFRINSEIHTSEGTPPELVWGIGIGRWKHKIDRVDMPIIEQLVDIEVEDGGAIVIHPRDLAPRLSLKPYLELEIDGAAKLQRNLQERLEQILLGEVEFSPFTTAWEPLLATSAAQLSSTGTHIDREQWNAGERLENIGEDLRITSCWTIFGRARSNEARAEDLEALRKRVGDTETDIPDAIRGYAVTPPDTPAADTSAWGIDSAVLGGIKNTWTAPTGTSDGGDGIHEPSATPKDAQGTGTEPPRVHFFPLPFNEEQGNISDMIDDRDLQVVCVSGPPGTGKTHSIANIISHQMSLGKRVLVTARTPEAIAAVREKLPLSLQPLVIASVGTDRESAQQLQEAVTELSNEVVGLNENDALALKSRLESDIVACDADAQKADEQLSQIARVNLAPIEWNGDKHTPMEMVEILSAAAADFDWFTDRPSKAPPAQLDDTLTRLQSDLPDLAGDIVYAGADLPAPEDLPGTADLIAAHDTERARHRREIPDYSTAPTMARDTAGADQQGRAILGELRDLSTLLDSLDEQARTFATNASDPDTSITCGALSKTLSYLETYADLANIATVRYPKHTIPVEEVEQAAQRGAAGQKPVPFSFFNGAMKQAIASVRVDGREPSSAKEWKTVHQACRLQKNRSQIVDVLRPFIDMRFIGEPPHPSWEIAVYLDTLKARIRAAIGAAERIETSCDALKPLFPYGLDFAQIRKTHDLYPAIFALEGNLPDDYEAPEALTRIQKLSRNAKLPVEKAIASLADAIGKGEVDGGQIVKLRGAITAELDRLAKVMSRLKALGNDLDSLAEAGAPYWASRLQDAPLDAPDLIPETWRDAWSWAQMSAQVDKIIELGNGDKHREAKAEAMKRRRKHFEELIHIRTLLGLRARMTPSIRQALEAFTQAVSKIGTGKGKKAPRYIREARLAARKASSAAPVWIMPEYKIPEQLPAEFGDFDLVILDEASQSDITALAALARGKKVLVVGDEEQVSPSAVGIQTQKINALRAEHLTGLPNAGLIDENSSIFEITKRMHPDSHVMLREHFRCVAPIIQFSTRFYSNALVPLRVPKASERFDPPLCDVYIPDATRQGKTNAHEARWIVDEIARLVADPTHDGRDIGVISLIGAEQAEKIGRMLVEDPRVGPEVIEKRHIIYGDARTMQGQERSIVFLSMVATPKTVRSQTTKADQQRINVAMSRAKDRLYLVRSVELEDLSPGDIKAAILEHFQNPMPDGRGMMGSEVETLLDRCDSGFEREVLQRLLDSNYRVRPQVPAGGFFIDLVVEGNEDRRLAIELDGDRYHGPDVWDRDMARQAALERAGWVFWRVFGSQWKANREFWWQNLLETLDRMQITPIGAGEIDERFTETITVSAENASNDGENADDPDWPEVDPDHDHEPETGSMARAAQPGEPTQPDPYTPPGKATEPSPTNPAEEKPVPSSVELHPMSEVDQMCFPLDDPDADRKQKIIGPGSTVKLEKIANGGGKMHITLVDSAHDPENGYIGTHTPLGQALLDARTGDTVEYHAGAYLREVRVLSVD